MNELDDQEEKKAEADNEDHTMKQYSKLNGINGASSNRSRIEGQQMKYLMMKMMQRMKSPLLTIRKAGETRAVTMK